MDELARVLGNRVNHRSGWAGLSHRQQPRMAGQQPAVGAAESRTRQSYGHPELHRAYTVNDQLISPPSSPSEEAFPASPTGAEGEEKRIAKPVGKPSYFVFTIKEMQR